MLIINSSLSGREHPIIRSFLQDIICSLPVAGGGESCFVLNNLIRELMSAI
jgi:hypothetical protein